MTNHEQTESEILWNEARDYFIKDSKDDLLNTIRAKIKRDGSDIGLYLQNKGTMNGKALEDFRGGQQEFLVLHQSSVYVFRNYDNWFNLSRKPKQIITATMIRFSIYPQFNYAEERIPMDAIFSEEIRNPEAFEHGDQLPAVVIDVPVAELINIDKIDTDYMNKVAQDFIAELPHVLTKCQIINVASYNVSPELALASFDILVNFVMDDDIQRAFDRLLRDDISLGSVFYHIKDAERFSVSVTIHFVELRKRREEGF